MKVSLIQLDSGSDKRENLDKAIYWTMKAAEKGTDFIALPEVYNYRGSLEGEALINRIAENIPGESTEPLINIARKHGVNILAGSIYERIDTRNKVYNTSIMINRNGEIKGKYRKINLFQAKINHTIINEANIFEPGTRPVICEVDGYKIGLSICFDLRFPEIYREYFRQNVDIIVLPSSFTTKTGELHWEVLLRARAIENYCYVIAPNQVGKDGNGIDTFGHSMVIKPDGKIAGILDGTTEGILDIDITFSHDSLIQGY